MRVYKITVTDEHGREYTTSHYFPEKFLEKAISPVAAVKSALLSDFKDILEKLHVELDA